MNQSDYTEDEIEDIVFKRNKLTGSYKKYYAFLTKCFQENMKLCQNIFLASLIPPKIYFFKERDFPRKSCGFSTAIQENVFTRVNLIGGES